ncbi:hypothetical protein WJX77_011107 [Trebouxia sp. C0004]
MFAPLTTSNGHSLQHHISKLPSSRRGAAHSGVVAGAAVRRQVALRAPAASSRSEQQVLGRLTLPLLSLSAAAQLLIAGPASAIDFQQPLALPPLVVEWARVAEDEKATPDEIIGDLTASTLPGPADIADVVNPANPDSPASSIANKVIESVQSGPTSAQTALSDALGNPVSDVAPKLQDAIESPAELLKPGREVLVQRLQKDILPKIESQIAELSKQDEPNDATKAITKQLKSVQTDINRLVVDVQGGKTDAIQADASDVIRRCLLLDSRHAVVLVVIANWISSFDDMIDSLFTPGSMLG